MSSQKQSHRQRKTQKLYLSIINENDQLKQRVAYLQNKPPWYKAWLLRWCKR